jgi:molecular chaperone DnaK (HSP70)
MVPLVSQRIKRLFNSGQKIRYHEPMKAVALGAALHAAVLGGDAERFNIPPELRGVSGYSLGLRAINPSTGRVALDVLIRQNMPLPARGKKTYYTTRPDQQKIVLEFVQTRAEDKREIQLGRLVVGPLPSPRQDYPIEVRVEYGQDGMISAQAYDASTGVELTQSFGSPSAADGIASAVAQKALVCSTSINSG